MTVKDILSTEEIRGLTEPSDARGLAALAFDWAVIALAFAAVVRWPNPLTVLAALFVLAGRQLALSVLMHECAHKSLFKTKWLNEQAGKWLCAYPVYTDVLAYRAEHMVHHRYTQTERDPDLWLTEPFPTDRRGLLRKFGRDLTGRAGLRRVLGLTLLRVGYLEGGEGGIRKAQGKTWRDYLANGRKNLTGPILFNAAFLAILWMAGHPALFLLWWAAYMTTYSLFLRIRAIAEHAVVPDRADDWRNTRTTRVNPVTRFFLAPNWVNYHLEHHLIPNVPCYRLAEMHGMLRDRGAFERAGAPIASGYWEVLRNAASA